MASFLVLGGDGCPFNHDAVDLPAVKHWRGTCSPASGSWWSAAPPVKPPR